MQLLGTDGLYGRLLSSPVDFAFLPREPIELLGSDGTKTKIDSYWVILETDYGHLIDNGSDISSIAGGMAKSIGSQP